MATEIEQLRQEAEALKNQIRVSINILSILNLLPLDSNHQIP